ncbi:MAG: SDR family oxidoreductase [Bacteroidales bacterium]|mgnify:CR=1 FL=1|jgi:UDP-N-acetylglucosamine 4-epimerase|nr:SDR family oxidoreductase [Bacteroidales bacterium]HOL97043.1 SDR family oxidoreductase [Bacteroidales bacterium]HOM35952.1 SDR family oxidoreductase [Bacteroidales bacterium]HPD23434.1 SDR family oxidoreductase [Bacteroidales bacterium]HRS99398.1 SDR family oxidoreductase [Bacteroidales bacterium]
MQNNFLTGKKILVTGGAGFIGSNLVERLLELNNNVVCLDNLSTGKMKNLKELLSKPDFKFIHGDIRDLKTCKDACEDIEIVFHQAALGSVPRSINDPITTNSTNIDGFLNMLVAAKDAKVKRFIYAASSSTYGDSQELPKVEDRIGKPLSPYAITKYVNELYAKVFADLYGMECIGLRYFNVFGKNQDPEGPYAAVIPKFIKILINHQSPVINGDGNQTRDFTYIENVIQANLLAATVENKKAINTVYNVACGQSTSLNEITEVLIKLLSKFDPEISKIKPIYGPERAGDVRNSLASIEKSKNLLGYKPTHVFTKGIEEAVNWYYYNLKR